MLITPNGCSCAAANLEYGTCIACRGRKEAAGKGHRCRKCGTGIFSGPETELGVCTECRYG